MDVLKILLEPAILIITTFFLFFILTILVNYGKVEKNLKAVYFFLSQLNKKEVSYRFKELDEYMQNNLYTSTCWEDFKKALIFPDKIFSVAQTSKKNLDYSPDIYLTVDASYFFNEESLIYSSNADVINRTWTVFYILKNGDCIHFYGFFVICNR